jgi:hypothetical protein
MREINKRDIRETKRLGVFNVNTIVEYNLDSKIHVEIKRAFPKFKGVQKIVEITDGEVYRQMLIESLESNPFASSVTVFTAEEFNGMKNVCYRRWINMYNTY